MEVKHPAIDGIVPAMRSDGAAPEKEKQHLSGSSERRGSRRVSIQYGQFGSAVSKMSLIAHCIDNGPMKGFQDIRERERYYGRPRTYLIESYIRYDNTRRVQPKVGILTPSELFLRS